MIGALSLFSIATSTIKKDRFQSNDSDYDTNELTGDSDKELDDYF